jgi:hypothetical protein
MNIFEYAEKHPVLLMIYLLVVCGTIVVCSDNAVRAICWFAKNPSKDQGTDKCQNQK